MVNRFLLSDARNGCRAKRVSALFRKGYISERHELDAQMEELRTELFMLPIPKQNPEKVD